MSDVVAEDFDSDFIALRRHPYVYLIVDKANSKKKGAKSATLPKKLVWYNEETMKIEEMLLDVDAAGESSKAVAKAIKHSLIRLTNMGYSFELILLGQGTDSGGGGTLKALS